MWRGYWRRAWGLVGYQGADGMRGFTAAAPGVAGHVDVAFVNNAHGDVAHVDTNKAHTDTPFVNNAHGDVAHVDTTTTGAAIRMR
jgi:ABC-type phosphate transport system substrate-binding protein